MTRKNTPADFWARVDRRGEDACWPWLGGKQSRGYGCLGYRGELWQAHRLAYQLTYGDLTAAEVVRHTCDNPPCCNPRHHVKGTQLDNIADATARGRMAHSERHYAARLTAAQVRQLRAAYQPGVTTFAALGKRFGVSREQARQIVRGSRWRHLADEVAACA